MYPATFHVKSSGSAERLAWGLYSIWNFQAPLSLFLSLSFSRKLSAVGSRAGQHALETSDVIPHHPTHFLCPSGCRPQLRVTSSHMWSQTSLNDPELRHQAWWSKNRFKKITSTSMNHAVLFLSQSRFPSGPVLHQHRLSDLLSHQQIQVMARRRWRAWLSNFQGKWFLSVQMTSSSRWPLNCNTANLLHADVNEIKTMKKKKNQTSMVSLKNDSQNEALFA